MDTCKQGHRVRCLTNATANALHVILTGIVEVTRNFLKSGYDYVLPGKIQSDRIEAEFGNYRGSSGGNYFISTEQVVSSLSMQRLKLYNQLGIQQSDDNEEISSCCTQDLQSNDEDIELVENCYKESSNLNDEERSSLYYISGYVAFKENLGIQVEESETLPRNSEFLQLVSRGKLAHPPPELYDLSLYYYSFFKARTPKCCNKIFLQASQLI